jgi:hypothetical protein
MYASHEAPKTLEPQTRRQKAIVWGTIAALGAGITVVSVLNKEPAPTVTPGHVRFMPSPEQETVRIAAEDGDNATTMARDHAYTDENIKAIRDTITELEKNNDGVVHPGEGYQVPAELIQQIPDPNASEAQK